MRGFCQVGTPSSDLATLGHLLPQGEKMELGFDGSANAFMRRSLDDSFRDSMKNDVVEIF